MTGGGSLGLRSSSYGSLQQHPQQQQQQQQQQLLLLQQQGAVAVPVAQGGAARGKLPKASLGGPSREKERVLHRIRKLAGRRGVGMLLLAVASVGVFVTILSASSKDDIPRGPETNWGSSSYIFHGTRLSSPVATKPVHTGPGNLNLTVKMPVDEETTQLHDVDELQDFPVFYISMFPKVHPCQNFSRSPPSYDKKRTGPRPCEVCYLPVEHAMALMPSSPSESPVLKNLTYFSEENSNANESNGGSIFGGHPSLQQRNDSFNIQESMTTHCGFFKGSAPGIGSGFDIDEMDLHDMKRCRGVVVASAIFGNYDILQQPKNISELTKRYACFYMFVDEETELYLRNHGILGRKKKVGLWRVVVVHNLPFDDPRRNGKVPKLLLHRLFPNAHYSLWIDGKLELVVDPFQILERFLWRKNATFAISRHYRRFDVFVEAEANKVAGKYDNASIDYQIEFYKNEGLTHYSEAKLPITSDVPEGCVIIREHIPITNLFTCLWFNEVDRFTSRDQLSFSTVRDKIMSKVNWSIEMFLDCERRNFVIQAYHRDLLEKLRRSAPRPPLPQPPPPMPILHPSKFALPDIASDKDTRIPPRKLRTKHGRDRKSGSRRMHPKPRGNDRNSI